MRMAKEPRKVGLENDNRFHPCPKKHVCVSTQSPKEDEIHYIEPFSYDGSGKEALDKIEGIINGLKRTKILKRTEKYLHSLFTTALFRFKDDIEFLIDDNTKLIHFRSQSRIGGYDWNANRNRMENIRTKFNKA